MKKKRASQSAFFDPRGSIGFFLFLAGVFLALVAFGQSQSGKDQWPTLAEQLSRNYDGYAVQPGSALEALIRENQDFSLLRDDEKMDKRGLPPWLRVWWRKGHPELDYSAGDPTGGYPLVLKEILEWMMTHQDLKRGPGVGNNSPIDNDLVEGPDLRISGAQTASRSESDIRINYFDPTKILSASNNISANGQQGIYYSTDGGTSWSQTVLPLTALDTFHSDPTADWTSDGRGWSSTLGITGSTVRLRNYFSTDNGATWTLDATPSGAQTSVDKQMVWVDHSATSPFQNQMYAIWHNGAPAYMNRRTAGPGGTWLAAPIQVSGAESSGTAIGADVKTNSAGDVFGAWPSTGNQKIFIAKSTNGGSSFGAPVQIATTFGSFGIGIPSFNIRQTHIIVALGTYKTATQDNVYATWTDLSGEDGCTLPANEPGSNIESSCKTRIWFSRSTDGGATWSPAAKINDQAGRNDQFNPWLAVDETNGGIGVMYYDTACDFGRKATDVWYQSSGDDGVSWAPAQKVTSAMTDETVAGADGGNQYGDYNGLSAYANMVFPSWTDRRNNAREEIWTSKITDTFGATPTPDAITTYAEGFDYPGGVAVDSAGNVYVADTDNETIRKITSDGVVSTLAGLAGVSGCADGSGSDARFAGPSGIAVDGAGNVYVADFRNNTIRKITSGGVVSTLAGLAGPVCGSSVCGSADGTRSAARFCNPTSVAVDSAGNVYVADYSNSTIRKITSDGTVNTLAGLAGTPGSADGAGSAARFFFPHGVALDSAGNAYVADTFNDTIRKITPGGVVSTLAGLPGITGSADGTGSAALFSYPEGVVVDGASNVYVADSQNDTIRKVTSGGAVITLAGLPGVSGHANGTGSAARFHHPEAVAVDTCGNLYVADASNNTIRVGLPAPTLLAPALALATVVSRKIHGSTGPFDVNLPLAGEPGVECRNSGGNHTLVFTFSNAVARGNANVTAGTGSVTGTPSFFGNTMTVRLSGVADIQMVTVTSSDVTDTFGQILPNTSVTMSVLIGDTNGNKTVNASDIAQTKEQSGVPVTGANFRTDINASGTVNASDIGEVQTNAGATLP